MTVEMVSVVNEAARSSARKYPPDDASWTMRDGTSVLIRRIRPGDEEMMVRFHRSLSFDTVRARYFGIPTLSQRADHDRLAPICHPDPGDIVLVADIFTPSGGREIIAVGRLSVQSWHDGEVALVVADSHQGHGLGTELLHRLIRVAKDNHLTHLYARVLMGNVPMLRLCSNVGMRISCPPIAGTVRAELDLDDVNVGSDEPSSVSSDGSSICP